VLAASIITARQTRIHHLHTRRRKNLKSHLPKSVHLYEAEICFWQTTDKNYNNKAARSGAVENIVCAIYRMSQKDVYTLQYGILTLCVYIFLGHPVCRMFWSARMQAENKNIQELTKISIIKFSRATSRVKWLNGGKNQSFENHLRPRPQGTEVAGVVPC
jgi:hypothetical protein